MKPAKLDCLFTFFNYGGNGGIPMCVPQLVPWWGTLFHSLHGDERIGRVEYMSLTDTPITLTRNRAIKTAIEGKFDVLVMLDSDNIPDLYVGTLTSAKPFFQSSFDFCYDRLMQGIPTVIAAPYCGPPPHPTMGGEENVYVFKWQNNESDIPFGGMRIVAYDRDQAAIMRGIHPAAALPTGVCMFTTKVFECLEPPYVAYEWTDKWQAEKASTEDVFVTRNLSIAGAKKWGTNIVFCNWDAWAGHYKPKLVGKPVIMPIDNVADVFVHAVRRGFASDDQIVHVGWDNNKTPFPPAMQATYAEASVDGDSLFEAVGVDYDGNVKPVDQLHYKPPGKIKPVMVDGTRYDANESVVSAENRDGLGAIMRQAFGRLGSEDRRLVYVGIPDQGTLATMAVYGKVYCVFNREDASLDDDGFIALENNAGVRFVPCDGDLAYQDFWENAEADMVFVQKDAMDLDVFEVAMDAASDSAMVIGDGTPPELPCEPLTMDGTGLWAVPKAMYREAIHGNGKRHVSSESAVE